MLYMIGSTDVKTLDPGAKAELDSADEVLMATSTPL